MAKILIQNLFNRELEIKDCSKTLLHHFHRYHLDWMHTCGGKGRCTSCKVIVLEGIKHFNNLTEAELKYLQMGALQENERLTCQARIHGDVLIRAPEEYKLPHLQYSE
jgi:2Fe-2S ferredoxin